MVGHRAKEVLTLLLKDLLVERRKSKTTARIFSLSICQDKYASYQNKEDCQTSGVRSKKIKQSILDMIKLRYLIGGLSDFK